MFNRPKMLGPICEDRPAERKSGKLIAVRSPVWAIRRPGVALISAARSTGATRRM
jgi:hypothetical protein